MPITNGIVSSKIYDKPDGFNFEKYNFPFLDGDVSCTPPMVYTFCNLFVFLRVCSNVDYFNNRKRLLTSKLLKVIDTINIVKLFLFLLQTLRVDG